ncbi:hypothetical protein HMSSN139_14720 [Paenibacillus sp. HMSSN-139]|nr:hypothetical protein HMSSN139_14720 [Paenibacillus sp. HMSSN-139]
MRCWKKAIIHRVHFKDCKLTGLNLSKINAGSVTFEHCIMNISDLVEASLKQVRFLDCSLQNVNFYGCKFKEVELLGSDLNEADFNDTSLKGMDISTCTFERVDIPAYALAGCTVSPEQAIGFAKLLGLIVK